MPRRSSGYHGKTQQELNAQSFGHVVDKRYNSPRWRKLAKAYLAKHPMCIADGCNRLATVCDHITAVVDGGDFWRGPFQPLCAQHHNSKSAREKWARHNS